MYGSNSCMNSSAEETLAAEDGLLIYCKPVELYNILHRRALKNPLFLQRCLHYKIEERRRWRLQMTISLVSTMAEGVQTQDMFPLYFLLAKPLFDTALTGHSAVYHLIQSCVMTSFNETEMNSRADASFIVPEINKFSLDAKAGKLTVLLVSFGDTEMYLPGEELSKGSVGGYCLWGKIPVESLCNSSERCVNLTWGHRVEMLSNVDMRPCYLEPSRFEEGSPITFQTGWNPGFMISKKVFQRHVQVNIAAKLVGEIEKSPYESFACKNIPSSTLSNIIRLRAGNVIFNYRDRNNMLRKTEVTEDFACPFCLVQCACFKGLRCHLISSHDLFNFEFWVTEEYQAVNVSVKNDFLKSETIADGADPKLLPFLFCSKSRMRRRRKDTVQKSKNVYPLSMGSGSPRQTTESTVRRPFPNKNDLQNDTQAENNDSDIANARACIEHGASNLNILGVDPECVPSVSGSDPTTLIMLPCAKSRKISFERSDSRNRVLLKKKRQFFHSHRAQPMTLDEVLSDRDSEDELDDDIADFEDRRMLDDFVDVTKDEKHLMHLWNSFVRRQRVLADGHVPWACEAFSKHHGQELVQAPPLLWCWRLFMIKLWNHSLVDARTMNNCNIILQEYQTQIR